MAAASFSASAKNEICAAKPEGCCMGAELAALTFVCGSISLNHEGMHLRYGTELLALAKRIYGMVTGDLGLEAAIEVRDNQLKKAHSYSITVEDARALLSALGLEDTLPGQAPPAFLTKKECCRASFLRGVFLGCGTVSNPKKSYHLEFVLHSAEMADYLIALLGRYKIPAKRIARKQTFVVYLNEGDSIAQLLALVGAHASILHFENVRILKEMRNNVNRAVNCETANINKTVDAAMQQLRSIETIKRHMGLDKLSGTLLQAAELRIENPQATLFELCELCGATKSAMNHRLRKINQIAQSLGSGD